MIRQMKRLSVIILKKDAKAVMDELAWLSCVEVEKSTDETAALLHYEDCSEKRASLENDLAALTAAIPLLSPYRTGKKGMSLTRPVIEKNAFAELPADATAAIAAAKRATEIERELSACGGEETALHAAVCSYEPWRTSALPLDFEGTESTRYLLGTLPANTDMDAASAALAVSADGALTVGLLCEDSAVKYVCVLFVRNREKDVQSSLAAIGFSPLRFPKGTGTAEEMLTDATNKLAALAEKTRALTAEKKALAVYCDNMEVAYDLVSTALSVLTAREKTGGTESTVVITGWMPAKQEKRLATALSPFICSYELADPAEGEDVPVALKNPVFADPFESLIGLYSYPKYGSFDPTVLVAVWFSLFFGLMSADFGYGLLTVVGCLLFLKLRKPRRGMSRFLKMFAISGSVSMVTGILFNGWFGDLPKQFAQNILGIDGFAGIPHLLDPIEDPITFFILALAFGVAHLLCGMVVKMIMLIRQGEVFSAIFDIGSWFVVYIGIGLYFLLGTAGAVVALVGVAMVVLTHGRHQKNIIMKFFSGLLGLYDIVSFLSDVLSYSRVLALGLSSAVIASVFNVLATLGGQSWISLILFPLVFVLGHLLNLALSLLSSFIHASRLQYVEFFGKFYEDGGREFNPVAPQLKYSDISAEN